MGYLLRASLFNGYLIAGGNLGVNGGGGGGDIEGDIMFFSQHGQGIGADFIGRIAVSGNAVGADDDAVNLPRWRR